MGPFLMLIGIGLLYVAVKGKSDPFLTALNIKLPNVDKDTSDWMANNVWGPLAKTISASMTQAIGNIKFPGT